MDMMRRYLTEAEQQALLRAAKGSSDPLALRDYHWMRLLIGTGMRVQEFALLTAQQAEQALASGWLITRAEQRKGGRHGHEYLVTQSVREGLEALLELQSSALLRCIHNGPEPLVWGRALVAGQADGMSVRSYQARMKLWAKAAGLDPRISPHWLRHTRGMNIIHRSRSRNPLKVVQQALGHESIASTGIYTRMAREEYVRDLQAIDGGRMSKRAAKKLAAGQGGVA
jgi:site-specific recombinase XerD